MKTLQIKWSTIFLFIVGVSSFLLCTSCKKETTPTKTKIYGNITIDNVDTWAAWQDSGVVEITIFPEFSLDPPSGWGEVPDDFFGPGVLGGTFALGAPYNAQNPIILDYVPGQNVYPYELEIEAGSYSALALGFRHNTIVDPTKKTATLGVHWEKPNEISHGIVIKIQAGPQVMTIFDYPAPVSIQINEGEEKEINFKADFNFVNEWFR